MRGRKKALRGGKSRGGTSARDHTISNHAQESTGTDPHSSHAYGMAKGPRQKMAGAAKPTAGKIRRVAGADYAGSTGG